jgi:hypothetical protein
MVLFAVSDYLSQPRFVLLGLIALFVLYLLYRFVAVRAARGKVERPPATPIRSGQKGPILLKLDSTAPATPSGAARTSEVSPKPSPSFRTLDRPLSPTSDLLHAVLVILAVIVAAGFILVIVPQTTFDNVAQNIQARRSVAQKESLAFLYLGDEVKDKDFQVRGVVRNITDQQLENVDASVRLYAIDGRLLQTTVVRLDKETIAPDETAEFHMVYSNYDQNIGSYSVDFVTRDGALVNYKDMRAARPRE